MVCSPAGRLTRSSRGAACNAASDDESGRQSLLGLTALDLYFGVAGTANDQLSERVTCAYARATTSITRPPVFTAKGGHEAIFQSVSSVSWPMRLPVAGAVALMTRNTEALFAQRAQMPLRSALPSMDPLWPMPLPAANRWVWELRSLGIALWTH